MSLNVVVNHVAEHAITADQEAANRLRSRLAAANSRWDAVCKSASRIQGRLQSALMQVFGRDYFVCQFSRFASVQVIDGFIVRRTKSTTERFAIWSNGLSGRNLTFNEPNRSI